LTNRRVGVVVFACCFYWVVVFACCCCCGLLLLWFERKIGFVFMGLCLLLLWFVFLDLRWK